MMLRITLSALFVIATAACERVDQLTPAATDVAQLKRDLGEFRYFGLDPQLGFRVRSSDFSAAEDRFDQPKLTYTVSIRQHNQAFPLLSYNFSGIVSIMNTDGAEIEEFFINGEVSDGVGSVAGIEEFYGDALKGFRPAELAALRFRVKEYDWSPMRRFAPHDPPE